MVARKTKEIITTVDTDLKMEDLYLHVQLLQSEARAAVEAGLEMGNGEEEDRPGLDARTRLPPVLQAPIEDADVGEGCWPATSDPNGPSGARIATTTRCRASAAIDAGDRNFSPPDPL
jgi:hypothetical protein